MKGKGTRRVRGDNDGDAESLSRHFHVSPDENCNLSRQKRESGIKTCFSYCDSPGTLNWSWDRGQGSLVHFICIGPDFYPLEKMHELRPCFRSRIALSRRPVHLFFRRKEDHLTVRRPRHRHRRCRWARWPRRSAAATPSGSPWSHGRPEFGSRIPTLKKGGKKSH